MPENELTQQQQKELAFYSAVTGAWLDTRFELDRQLLSLSVAAIGVLITLLTTVGSCCIMQSTFYLIALGGFLLCAGAILLIFRLNSAYLESIVKKENDANKEKEKKLLIRLDKFASAVFIVAIFASIGVGVAKAVLVPSKEGSTMSDKMSAPDSIKKFSEEQPDVCKSYVGFDVFDPSGKLGGGSGSGGPKLKPESDPANNQNQDSAHSTDSEDGNSKPKGK